MMARLYDATLCSRLGVALQPPIRRTAALDVSVAIPHYRRSHQIHRPLRNILRDHRIRSILVVDDGSPDEEFRELERRLASLDRERRVTLVRREVNMGALQTKLECVERAGSEWVILLDSDNTLFRRYLDAMFALRGLDPYTIYCPSAAFPHYSFSELAGRTLDFETCAALTRSGILRRVYVINDGNFLLHRRTFLGAMAAVRDLRRDVADVMVTNFLWLSLDGRLNVVPFSPYYHRIDGSSFWHRTQQASRWRVLRLFERFEKGERWDERLLHDLLTSY